MNVLNLKDCGAEFYYKAETNTYMILISGNVWVYFISYITVFY